MGTMGQSITLANSIIGVGVLAMPFCFQQCGVLLASLILLFMGLVSRLCCHFLLKSALLARRRNFEFLAFKVFGPVGKLTVELGIIGFLMGTCIAYFVVVGDLGPQIISKMFNINQSDILRTSIMVIVSLVCVLPLGLLRNVDSLSNVSAATIGFYLCLVFKIIGEAASQLFGGEWQPWRLEMWKPSGVLQCVPIFSMALFCQTQLFEIFESMPTLSLEKMNVVTKNAIHICTAVYFTLGLFGYIAFCTQTISGNILVSLSPTMASDVIKLGFVMSLAFSFPLIIFPCRASLYSFLYKKVHSPHHDHIVNHSIPVSTFRCITVSIIAAALFVSLLIPNIELVLGFLGSTIGVLICVVFPAACFINLTFKDTNERLLAKAVLVLGLIIMVLGTYANLQAAESIERYDEKHITQERIDEMVEQFFQKQSQEVKLKQVKENEPVLEQLENVKREEVFKESEVQPPNPVPPESRSNEKKADSGVEANQIKDLLPEHKDIVIKNSAEIVPDSHPKDLKSKLNNKIDNNAESVQKDALPIKDKVPQLSDRDKADLKKQKLLETIKQHGEEQKEINEEQKELLNEIKEMHEEPKKSMSVNEAKIISESRKSVDSDEAKKIAVESIQKIAKMAIESLSGVTDLPPVQPKSEQKSEPLEKIAEKAVQEIAKKAAETLDAIKEHDESDNKKVQEIAKKAVETLDAIKEHDKSDNKKDVQNYNQESIPQVNNINNPPKNIEQIPQSKVNNDIQQINIKENKIPLKNLNILHQPPDVDKVNKNQNEDFDKLVQNNIKEHSHSPDEPKSYIEGENAQKIKDNINNILNAQLPLAVAMNGKTKLYNENASNKKQIQPVKVEVQPVEPGNIHKSNNVNNQVSNLQNGNNVSGGRQKREITDCTDNRNTNIKEKVLCDNYNDNGLATKVDLADVGLRKAPIDPNIIHHVRSLKSFENDKSR